jgi:hypothetical protein
MSIYNVDGKTYTTTEKGHPCTLTGVYFVNGGETIL